jgi:hypothetical protein
MQFTFPVTESYTIGLRHGDQYPSVVQKILHLSGEHRGVDIIAPEGRTVVAPADGVIVEKRVHYQGGNIYLIQHDEGMKSWMAHFSKQFYNFGDLVTKGNSIGEVGSTGLSTAPHLHWHCYNQYGDIIDPMQFISNETIMILERIVRAQKKKLEDLLGGKKAYSLEVETGKLYEIEEGKKKEFKFEEGVIRALFPGVSKSDLEKIPNK